MFSFSAFEVFCAVLALFFAIGGVINGIAPKRVKDDYERWGYPRRFHYLTAVLELAVAVLFLGAGVPRLAGALLGFVVMLAALATLLRAREASHAIPAAAVGMCCLYVVGRELL